jgi:hypothetical protein
LAARIKSKAQEIESCIFHPSKSRKDGAAAFKVRAEKSKDGPAPTPPVLNHRADEIKSRSGIRPDW